MELLVSGVPSGAKALLYAVGYGAPEGAPFQNVSSFTSSAGSVACPGSAASPGSVACPGSVARPGSVAYPGSGAFRISVKYRPSVGCPISARSLRRSGIPRQSSPRSFDLDFVLDFVFTLTSHKSSPPGVSA
jgi:hypothetical protein